MTGEWFDTAVQRAGTPEGAADLHKRAEEAELLGDAARAAALRAAVARGEAERAAREDAERLATPGRPGLQRADVDRVVRQFDVADEQVRRDHVISHMLAAPSAMPGADDLIFFGGTALSRT